MGELRHINAHRDDLVRAIAAAPADATFVLVIDQPEADGTRILWHAPGGTVPGRVWAWFSSVFQALALGTMRKTQ